MDFEPFFIISELSGLALEVNKGSKMPRVKLVTNALSGALHQQFRMINQSINCAHTGMVLDVKVKS